MTLQGIDVASYQAHADWPAVAAAGITFAIIKSSGGTDYHNPAHVAMRDGARAAGLITHAYHYAGEPTGNPGTADEEVAYHLAMTPPYQPGEMSWLDLEEARPDVGDLGAWALRWLELVEQATGVTPGLYTGEYFLRENRIRDPRLARFPLWLASWQDTYPPVSPPWRAITVWQYDSTATVANLSPVDADRFEGTREQFLALGKQAAPTFQHAEGWLDPLIDDFDWTQDGTPGAGIVTYRAIRAYNDEERKTYWREWSAATGFSPWVEVQ